jgi:hypothetical protein
LHRPPVRRPSPARHRAVTRQSLVRSVASCVPASTSRRTPTSAAPRLDVCTSRQPGDFE